MNTELKIPENTVIHCPTEVLANKVLEILGRFGCRWNNDRPTTSKNNYEDYAESTCYNPHNNNRYVTYSEIDFYKGENYKIIEATEFIKLYNAMTPKEILIDAVKDCKFNYHIDRYEIVIVETVSENSYICIDNNMLLNMNMKGYMKVSSYDEYLCCNDSNFNIKAIYVAIAGYPIGYKTDNSTKLVWERPAIKEVTLEEIAKKFGVNVCDIRIKD